MTIIYILKKGLQCYPPCLAQVLYLNDLGVDLEVYHGKNSEYVNTILDKRNIRHITLRSDKESNNSFYSYLNFISYTFEVRKLLAKFSSDSIIWFGNCESAITLGKRLKRFRFILTVLELYDYGTLYDKLVKRIIKYAELSICCEKHRAAIMKDRYSLKHLPFIIPNKPYPIDHLEKQDTLKLPSFKGKKIVLYQGLVQSDRPIDNIARALKIINDPNLVFAILGKYQDDFKNYIQQLYPESHFFGYIPAPQHLEITRLGHIGIAIYDDSNLNNQFCAPNKIYEYAAFGIPMITSLNLGLTETVGQAGAAQCVDFTNIDSVVKGIKAICLDHAAYSQRSTSFYNSVNCKDIIAHILNLLYHKNNNL